MGPYTAMCVRWFLAQQQVTELFHPLYSPDLVPADFFHFPRLKLTLKGNRFSNTSNTQAAVTMELNTFSKEDFFKRFQHLYERYEKRFVDDGNYFKRQ
ncbi:mariner Mos1 transposase [Trichonephila clavata]|uniref:Mariner Mos1 transposase n=1 Tax=Trichonephila clavata TaxID=2740835 RepID=A0A8X6FGI3_TRICU|nr:mariner Mos1 transposase [Trichonephila clavata]